MMFNRFSLLGDIQSPNNSSMAINPTRRIQTLTPITFIALAKLWFFRKTINEKPTRRTNILKPLRTEVLINDNMMLLGNITSSTHLFRMSPRSMNNRPAYSFCRDLLFLFFMSDCVRLCTGKYLRALLKPKYGILGRHKQEC